MIARYRRRKDNLLAKPKGDPRPDQIAVLCLRDLSGLDRARMAGEVEGAKKLLGRINPLVR